jgi:hypothetical protein
LLTHIIFLIFDIDCNKFLYFILEYPFKLEQSLLSLQSESNPSENPNPSGSANPSEQSPSSENPSSFESSPSESSGIGGGEVKVARVVVA